MRFLIIILLISTSHVFSQERTFISGKLIDATSAVKNAHVINLQSKQGTFTNKYGEFVMYAKENDTLQISSVQYNTKLHIVTKKDIEVKKLLLNISKKTYELNEVVIKKHNLSGSLYSDTKLVPKNRRDSLLRSNMDLSKVDLEADVKEDYIDRHVRPQLVKTDPTPDYFGGKASIYMPFKHSEKLWALRKELAFKKSFPAKILAELGEKFFFKDLKIPVDKYYHFLEYCNPLGIEDLYKEGKTLEVIKILQEQSKSYLKIINKQ